MPISNLEKLLNEVLAGNRESIDRFTALVFDDSFDDQEFDIISNLPHTSDNSYFLYMQGIMHHHNENFREARRFYDESIKLGNVDAMGFKASILISGHGFGDSYKKSVVTAGKQLLDGAIQLNNSNAMTIKAFLLEEKEPLTRKSINQALELYDRAIALNNSQAMYNKAIMLTNGIQLNDGTEGCTKDYPQAISLLEKAAKLGHTQALFERASMLMIDVKGEQDYKQAISSYKQYEAITGEILPQIMFDEIAEKQLSKLKKHFPDIEKLYTQIEEMLDYGNLPDLSQQEKQTISSTALHFKHSLEEFLLLSLAPSINEDEEKECIDKFSTPLFGASLENDEHNDAFKAMQLNIVSAFASIELDELTEKMASNATKTGFSETTIVIPSAKQLLKQLDESGEIKIDQWTAYAKEGDLTEVRNVLDYAIRKSKPTGKPEAIYLEALSYEYNTRQHQNYDKALDLYIEYEKKSDNRLNLTEITEKIFREKELALTKKYCAEISGLYDNIHKMKVYALENEDDEDNIKTVEMMRTANALKEKLDIFLINSFKTPITQKAENQFKEDFVKLLHENDEAINTHRQKWKPIIANILIALTGIGFVALLTKAFVHAVKSAVNKTEPSFNKVGFFAQTKSSQIVSDIEEATKGISLQNNDAKKS